MPGGPIQRREYHPGSLAGPASIRLFPACTGSRTPSPRWCRRGRHPWRREKHWAGSIAGQHCSHSPWKAALGAPSQYSQYSPSSWCEAWIAPGPASRREGFRSSPPHDHVFRNHSVGNKRSTSTGPAHAGRSPCLSVRPSMQSNSRSRLWAE